MKQLLLSLLVILPHLVARQGRADVVVLYDGALGTSASGQSWVYGTNPFFGPDAVSVWRDNATHLDTTPDISEQAGYFSIDPIFGVAKHEAVPVLDRGKGFQLDLTFELVREAHLPRDDNGDGRQDRAGFSIIALSEDHWGVELAFQENRIWVYEDDSQGENDRFTQAESIDFAAGGIRATYQLRIVGNRYELSVDQSLILSGPVRNYQFLTGTIDPYEIPSFLFWGDDTASASSEVRMEQIMLTTELRRSQCDIDLDSVVDASDASVVFANWGQPGLGDVNYDSLTDAADAAICFADWTGDVTRHVATPEPTAAHIVYLVAMATIPVARRQRVTSATKTIPARCAPSSTNTTRL